MRIERTRNAMNSIAVGLLLRLYQTVVPFLMRTAMIHFMGIEYLGLNGLFSSVLHILNLAELGVGVAMVYSMYKPIAEDDTVRICALMKLYRVYYRIIGLVIGALGLMLLPFVPMLVLKDVPAGINIYLLYLLNLGATVLTYWLFAYRNCLLQAHQRLDVISAITIASSTIQFTLQFLILVYIKNYYLYVMVLLLSTIMNNILTAWVTCRKYPQYAPAGELDKAEVAVINGRIRDLFSSKLGSVVLQHADTIVISSFLGLTVLAVYQNYFFIMSAVLAIIEMIISSITPALGNSFIVETKEKNAADLMKFSFMYLWMTGVCSCCFLGLYQPFVRIWVGEEFLLSFGLVICLAAYFFAYTLIRFLSIYKDAAGLWHEDRFRPLVTACVNLTLNLLMVRHWGLFGVVISTVVSLCAIEIPWIIRILFSRVFDRRTLRQFAGQLLRFAGLTAVSGAGVCLLCAGVKVGAWGTLALCMLISLLLPNLVFAACFRRSDQLRLSVQMLDRMTKNRLVLERRLYRK